MTKQLIIPDKIYILLNLEVRQLPFDAMVIARASPPMKSRLTIAHVEPHPLITT
jgi:hypothetical protein